MGPNYDSHHIYCVEAAERTSSLLADVGPGKRRIDNLAVFNERGYVATADAATSRDQVFEVGEDYGLNRIKAADVQ